MRAEVLSYSRTRGLFAGIALDGAVIKQDKDGNWNVYGERVNPRELLLTPGQRIPAAAIELVEALRNLAPVREE
jgi:lipid-binding SYLF domain-containing protein